MSVLISPYNSNKDTLRVRTGCDTDPTNSRSKLATPGTGSAQRNEPLAGLVYGAGAAGLGAKIGRQPYAFGGASDRTRVAKSAGVKQPMSPSVR